MTGKSRSLPKKKLPSYLLHKPTGQARCRINGKDHYLGTYGTDESRIRYGKLLADMAGAVDQRMIDAWMGHQTEEMRTRYRHLLPTQQLEAINSVFG